MVSKRQAITDAYIVTICSLIYVAASVLGAAVGWVIVGVVATLAIYTIFVLSRRGESLADFGLRRDNFWRAAVPTGVGTAIAAALMVAWAAWRGGPLFHWETLILVPLYPLWGIIQQLIFQGILHRRLMQLWTARSASIVATSVLFALVHVADWRVVVLTFPAGLFWSWVYVRWPNIWVLGLSHGFLGALLYPLVLMENPIRQVF